MKPETLTKYKKRREEGYDVDSADELNGIWSKLNNLQLSDRELPNTSQELAHPDSAGGHIDSLTSKPKSLMPVYNLIHHWLVVVQKSLDA